MLSSGMLIAYLISTHLKGIRFLHFHEIDERIKNIFTDLIYYRLEERRKAKGAAYYERKKLALRQLSEAKKNAKVDTKTTKALESFGY